MLPIVLSYVQAEGLLRARETRQPSAIVSPDLGLTTAEVALDPMGAHFPDGQLVTWGDLATIAQSERSCFVLERQAIRKVQVFSETTNLFYSLMPTRGAPTMLVSGIPMHRVKGIDPQRDTVLKVKSIAPLRGHVLDTATGLGYTAIEAAKSAERVTSIELDPTALEIARLNPWSQALFENPSITQLVGDSFDVIQELESEAFTRIVHDPPTLSLAGALYSGEFYRQLFRVLGRGGRMFHYIGDLESKLGQSVSRGVIRRLGEAGFSRVVRRAEAFGLVAYK
jgi:predicted methyltransferase